MNERATDGADPLRILFVCLGNICRSPLAEGIFRKGLADRVRVDSAGTGDWHVGEPPHPRSAAVAERRGVRLDSRARQVRPADLEDFDYVVAMDASNLAELRRLASGPARIHRLREFDPMGDDSDLDVPDPYGGGPEGFERVHDVVERSCTGLLEHLRRSHAL